MFRKYFLLGLFLFATTVSSLCFANDKTVTLPFKETFENAQALDNFIIIDGNNDGKTWEYALINYGSTDLHSVRYAYSSQKAD